MKEKLNYAFLLFLRGMGMGAADLIPGVSGGTIALITGIYKKFVDSIKSINTHFLKLIKQKQLNEAWKHINGNFLLAVFSGILVSVFSLARLFSYLLEHYQMLVWAFFFGLIMASAIYIGRKIEKWDSLTILFFVFGITGAFYITLATPATAPETLWYVFLSGGIGICAMVLPGISGSFILLLIGSYALILEAVTEFNITILGIFIFGCIVGIILFSNIISWLLKKYHSYTMAVLTGLMLGSLNKLWPWKEVLETRFIRGEEVPIVERNILPAQFQQIEGADPMIWQILLLMFMGFILIFLINLIANVSWQSNQK